jgi:hypothetical protein
MAFIVNAIVVICAIIIFVLFGFISDIHGSNCAMPTIDVKDYCPNICECDKDLPECNVPQM